MPHFACTGSIRIAPRFLGDGGFQRRMFAEGDVIEAAGQRIEPLGVFRVAAGR